MGGVIVIDDISTIMDDIHADISSAATGALQDAGDRVIPNAWIATFRAAGERGGKERWPNTGRLDLRKVNINRPDQPLRDTEGLMRSMELQNTDERGGVIAFEYWPSDKREIGYEHNEGLATTPEGSPIVKREHMFIVHGSDTAAINRIFEAEVRRA